ncbi:MAG: hypothetical protein LDL50_05965 [Chloroflexi bacterium]|nr:hypothetical protein [Chloroflexota bacterium]MCA2002202.1 hypothetical protein [Chloroflexota bacterium]
MVEKSKVKPKAAVKKTMRRLVSKPSRKSKAAVKPALKQTEKEKTAAPSARVVPSQVVKRVINPFSPKRPIKRAQRSSQFSYMKAPGYEHEFEVGDTVEVFCDHEKSRERIRGWVKGIVVQVDYKMVAVQFRSNVYLTDGWMVPDRILWYPLNSEHIRPVASKRTAKKDILPDY